jgi:hypothetical protein
MGLMKKALLLLSFLFLCSNLNAANLCGDTNHICTYDSAISASETWVDGNTYVLLGDVDVSGAATVLTIQPGVTVKFSTETDLSVSGSGRIVANGTASKNIFFLGCKDQNSFAGTTNADTSTISDCSGNLSLRDYNSALWVKPDSGMATSDSFSYLHIKNAGYGIVLDANIGSIHDVNFYEFYGGGTAAQAFAIFSRLTTAVDVYNNYFGDFNSTSAVGFQNANAANFLGSIHDNTFINFKASIGVRSGYNAAHNSKFDGNVYSNWFSEFSNSSSLGLRMNGTNSDWNGTVYNNLFTNSPASRFISDVAGTRYGSIYNNTIANVSTGILLYNSGSSVYNNLFLHNYDAHIVTNGTGTTLVFNNANFDVYDTIAGVGDVNSETGLLVEPILADGSDRNYLLNTSASGGLLLVNAGNAAANSFFRLRTTKANNQLDIGLVDIGYHYDQNAPYVIVTSLNDFNTLRGTQSIDFNLESGLGTVAALNAKLYYTDTNVGTGNTTLIVDQNLDSYSCSAGPQYHCNYPWNTTGITDGNYYLKLIGADTHGSQTDYSDKNFLVDNTKPSTRWDGNHNVWQKFDANIHLTCSDGNGSGCSSTKYRLDSDSNTGISYGSWQNYDSNILISTDGNWAIDFNSTDNAGNIGDTNTFYVLVDKTIPTITISSPANDSTQYGSTVTLIYLGSDKNSGIQIYWLSSDGTTWVNNGTNSTYSFTSQTSGLHTYYAIANDNADNNSSTASVSLTILNLPPDANITRIDTYPDDQPLPSFTYTRDGNLTIDFNVQDDTNNLLVDLNYSSSAVQGTGAVIVDDLNISALGTTGAFNCADTNFLDSTQCSIDWNISSVVDGNYFLLLSITDGNQTDFNASDNNFQVDNPVLFFNSEFLSNPTADSIQISVVPAENDANLYVEYGTVSGTYPFSTATQATISGTRNIFSPTGLSPETKYYYRVRYKRTQATLFGARTEHTFKTKKSIGTQFSFGIETDSHIYQKWSQNKCGELDYNALLVFQQTLNNVSDSNADFLINMGDYVQTHCLNCSVCSPDTDVNGESPGGGTTLPQKGTVMSQREAELRYRVAGWQYENISHSIPVFLSLGNHDGESGFVDEDASILDTTAEYSRSARLLSRPNPYSVYNAGDVNGGYYSFEWGDALFVVLDCMRYPTTAPTVPDDWTLGATQLAWLEDTLKNSTKKWKFLFSHHLIGGEPDILVHYQYGRGGLKATDNNDINGTFLGEQATIHQLMKTYGAQVFFYGHDHLFAFGEKTNLTGNKDGIFYVTGGMSSDYTDTAWFNTANVIDAYDYNNDGVIDANATKGFVRVDVNGETNVTISYIETGIDGYNSGNNNQTLFSYIIPASNIDVNVVKVDGFSDGLGLPSFSYVRDGNLTIDFNVQISNNNFLLLDLNYSSSAVQGTGMSIVNDLNISALGTTGAFNCADTNFLDSTQCSIDWNISSIGDGNYFLLVLVTDGTLKDFNASDNNFMIDNAPPTISISSPTNGSTSSSSTVTLEYSGVDANSGIARYWVAVDSSDSNAFINNGLNTSYSFTSQSNGVHVYHVKATDNADNNSSDANVTVTVSVSNESGSTGSGYPACSYYSGSNVCAIEETCPGIWLNAYNTTRCCSVACAVIASDSSGPNGSGQNGELVGFSVEKPVGVMNPSSRVFELDSFQELLNHNKVTGPNEIKAVRSMSVQELAGANESVKGYNVSISLSITNPTNQIQRKVQVVEEIPKSLLSSASLVQSEAHFVVLQEDPVLLFDLLGDLDQNQTKTIHYEYSLGNGQLAPSKSQLDSFLSVVLLQDSLPLDSCATKKCDDDNPCTVDYCRNGNCVFAFAVNGTECQNGFCEKGICQAGSQPVVSHSGQFSGGLIAPVFGIVIALVVLLAIYIVLRRRRRPKLGFG